jgi:tetratricopeptide (TPR) repeat protein
VIRTVPSNRRKRMILVAYVGILITFVMSLSSRVFADSVQDCQQDKDLKLRVQGCTELLSRSLAPAGQAVVYQYRGSAYLGLGQYDPAIDDLTKSINIQADALSYTLRGGAYEAQHRYDRAIPDFSAAIQLKPDVAELYLYRGNCRLAKGDTADSITDFNVVIQKKPGLPDGYYLRARANLLLNQNDATIGDLNKLVSLDPKWKAVALFYRALANEAKGQNALAESDFKSAADLEWTLAMERRWVHYLKSIQADGDYANWSGKPYDLYLRVGGP